MIALHKDKRRERAAKKDKFQPKPCWAEAFLILLLHKTGGQLHVSRADLDRFDQLKFNNKTKLSYDPVAEIVTLSAPEIKLKSVEEKKIIETPFCD
jgi:hypothetical protein